MRMIDADALKDGLGKLKVKGINPKYVQGAQDAVDGYFPQIIDDAPTIDAEPVKHAYWKEKQDMNGDTYYRCTNCGESFVFEEGTPKDNLYYRCPNCGAKMDLKDGESE